MTRDLRPLVQPPQTLDYALPIAPGRRRWARVAGCLCVLAVVLGAIAVMFLEQHARTGRWWSR